MGGVHEIGSGLHFTADAGHPLWHLDATGTHVYYDQTGTAQDGANNRTPSSATMFDMPLVGTDHDNVAEALFREHPTATTVTETCHFASYLVQRGVAIRCVRWSLTKTWHRPAPAQPMATGQRHYGGVTNEPCQGLPPDMLAVLRVRGELANGIR